MSALPDDAQRVYLLFNYGVMSAGDVIHWAEQQVAATESPVDSLLKLAWTKPSCIAEIVSQLNVLRRGSDVIEAFKQVLGSLYSYVKVHPEKAEQIT